MSDNDEEHKTGKVQKQFCPKNFIKRLEAAGYVRWDSCTWIKPADIPIMAARRKIKRARRRCALRGMLLAEAKTKRESGAV